MINLEFLGLAPGTDAISLSGVVTLGSVSNARAMGKLASLFPGVPIDFVLTPEGAVESIPEGAVAALFRAQDCETIRRNNPNVPNLCSATALDTIRTLPSSHVALVDTRTILPREQFIDYLITSREEAKIVAGSTGSNFAALDTRSLPPLPEAAHSQAVVGKSIAPVVLGGFGGAAVGGATAGAAGAAVGAVLGAIVGKVIA